MRSRLARDGVGPGMNARVDRVRRDIDDLGLSHALLRRLVGASERFFFPITQVVMQCDLTRAGMASGSVDVELRDLNADAIPLLEEFVSRVSGRRFMRRFQAYLRRGYHGQLVIRNEAVIGFTWWMEAGLPESCANPAISRLGLRLQPGDAYSWDVFLAPPARGHGIGSAFYVTHLEHLRSRGIRRVFLWVEGKNIPALRLYQRLGFEEISRKKSFLIASNLLFSPTGLYIKNRFQSTTPFDYRRLF